ncbi:FAD/NAD(P)-binding domain-containing protein [Neurospora intermedia]|uniref:FAD/NAD(P)-binding domain-containing protein n=1 Tax=Neurospora intermedia TaxID=5142 RepID=A0ABR3DT56_NEUIN
MTFKVIIVGGGPVGLYMAHAFERANIDYVILEQQDTVLNISGQLLFTWPQTVRLFDQIGLLADLENVALGIHHKKRLFGNNGQVTTTSNFWDAMQDNHGYPFLPLLRSELVKILYNHLKGRESNIRVNSRVTDIRPHATGVHVHLADGSLIQGSIVVGADGVHSRTRQIMDSLVAQHALNPARLANKPMVSTFYGIFGRASNIDLGIEPEVFFESRGGGPGGAVVQCLATKGIVQFVTLKPLPGGPTSERSPRYSDEEMDAYAASLADVAVCPGVTFGDVWAKVQRKSTRMLNQEEGFLDNWFFDRIVLVGDAVHKSTSVNGLGMTCGLHSGAVLANELHSLLSRQYEKKKEEEDEEPSTEELEGAFRRYQEDRKTEVKPIWNGGHAMIREVVKKGWVSWFWDRFVLPWCDMETFAKGLLVSVLLIRQGQILRFVPFEGRGGRVPWARKVVV